LTTFTDTQVRWLVSLTVAVFQIGIASFAAYSSNRDILSDGACIGGVFGTLINLIILIVILAWLAVVTIKSLKEAKWHAAIPTLLTLALSSTVAILIGQYAGLRCTV
jgi:uncharacterized membrane protein